MRVCLRTGWLFVLFCALVDGSVLGEPVTAPTDFGPGVNVLQIPAASFAQKNGITALWGTNFYVFPSGPAGSELIGSVILPAGASIQQLGVYYFDSSLSDLSVDLWAATGGASSPAGASLIQSVASSGTAGYGYASQPISPAYTVVNDVANDADGAQLLVVVHLPDSGVAEAGFKSVELRWQRAVSPAPAVATFNDVPVDHPFFQFIEALVASGVTAGCGSGNYCPDAPLTRAQMAAFLSKALGIYWPN